MEVQKIEYGDSVRIGKILKTAPSLSSSKVVKDIIDHINHGIALKLVDSDTILGVWCSREYDTHTSLSFFYVDESIRRKFPVIVFFKNCIQLVDLKKPLLIKTKDTTGFERYVKPVEGNPDVYQFIGLR